MTTRDASLDELLQDGNEPPEDSWRRKPSTTAWVVRTLVWSIGLAALVVTTARLMSFAVSFPVTLGLILSIFVLNRVLRGVAVPPPAPAREISPRDDDWRLTWPMPDGLFAASARWDTRLNWTQDDPERFSTNVLPLLGDLVDERLRQKHGFTRTSDPAAARARLGDPLWTFLSTPVTRSLTPQQLAGVVSQLEAL